MKITPYILPPSPGQPAAGPQPAQITIDAGDSGAPQERATTGRDLVVVRQPLPPVVHGARKDGQADQGGGKDIHVTALNMRHISPRKISQTGYDLYTIGAIGWDEYEMLAFQPELHPGYDATIGALIGDTAQPDRPQDFIEVWEKRLEFERRYNPENTRHIRQAEHLVAILRQIDSPTNLVA